jgi:phosphoglycerol transferase MdoB-like AlkP superfamily enzyme
MLTFLSALEFTVIFSFVAERFIKPIPPTITIKNILLQSLLVSALFLLVSLVVQRPVFSALAVSVFLIILSGVSNAKFHALREPLVFSDIAMFSQAFKHPRLYFPFLGLLPVIIMPLIIIGLIYTVLKLEPAMAISWQRITLSLIALGLCFYITKKLALTLTLIADPASDNADYGLLNALFAYAIQANTREHKEQITQTLESSPFASNNKTIQNKGKKTVLLSVEDTPPIFSPDFNAHNITVIQSESFFDARRLHPAIKTDVLENYDRYKMEAVQYGKLNVPAWGANTMRTEFSFLTGLKYEQMGLYRYYPYQYLQKMSIISFAKLLQSQGYHCVCIHPHPASFFGRDKIFPQMGFDEFIDIKSFNLKDTFGPYISDQAVTDKILEVSQQFSENNPDKPLFIFAITMENHGPLHLEKTTSEEQKEYYETTPCSDINDLTVYLRHLKNADKMIATLISKYRQFEKPSTLCFYGDHIPSMPGIYQQMDYCDEDSDYLIWHNKVNSVDITAKEYHISVDTLATTLLSYTGNLTR